MDYLPILFWFVVGRWGWLWRLLSLVQGGILQLEVWQPAKDKFCFNVILQM